MGKPVGILGVQSDFQKKLIDTGLLFSVGELHVNIHPLRDNLPDRHSRIQGCVRVLEYDLDILFKMK